ncbi:Coiled-coil domain-containing protein 97 [Blyttiomyces sp. JEL0837]|nr:Coiled-coil domain-containing protein 97 [Blyttiomyces sp. JEL0837]
MTLITAADKAQDLVLHILSSSQYREWINGHKGRSSTREPILEQLKTTPVEFLEQWGSLLTSQHLTFFDEISKDNYEIKFHLHRLRKRLNTRSDNSTESPSSQNAAIQSRNRRLKFINGGHPISEERPEVLEYFSAEAMRQRDPQLFEFYIGQHIPATEKRKPFAESVSLVDRIYHNMAECEHRRRLGLPEEQDVDVAMEPSKEEVEEDIIEYDTDEEPEPEYEPAKVASPQQSDEQPSSIVQDNAMTMEERDSLRLEFESIMKERFMSGQDAEFFDYKIVDMNADYDDRVLAERDAEDSYFDSEEATATMREGEEGKEEKMGDGGNNNDGWSEDGIGYLDTNLGSAPFYLLKPILARATYTQLENIMEWNPDREDIVKDGNELWKAFVLKKFQEVRQASMRSDFRPPRCWREYYKEKDNEYEEKLAATKRRLNEKKKQFEAEKEESSVKVLQKPIFPTKSTKGWSTFGPSARRENKFFKAAKKDLARHHRPIYDVPVMIDRKYPAPISRPSTSGSSSSLPRPSSTSSFTPTRPSSSSQAYSSSSQSQSRTSAQASTSSTHSTSRPYSSSSSSLPTPHHARTHTNTHVGSSGSSLKRPYSDGVDGKSKRMSY